MRNLTVAVVLCVLVAGCGDGFVSFPDQDPGPGPGVGGGGGDGGAGQGGSGGAGSSGQGGHGLGGGGEGGSVPYCPSDLLAITTPQVGTYCVSPTEITKSQYAAVLPTINPSGSPACSFNDDATPSCLWPAGPGEDDMPVTCVDGCDAAAYCDRIGARLCTPAEITAACSGVDLLKYPYGDNYDPGSCNGLDAGFGEPIDVGWLESCEGGFGGLFDVVGNASEWTSSCATAMGPGDDCDVHGGSASSPAAEVVCGGLGSATRGASGPDLGFRCCSVMMQ